MSKHIDLNADLGERPQALLDGTEEKIISLISSANIACGGHAGDDASVENVVRLCGHYGVAMGAHPSYPDRANFGRVEMPISLQEIHRSVFEQIRLVGGKAKELGLEMRHVKPHGALYSVAAHNELAAEAIANGAMQWSRDLALIGMSGTVMLEVWNSMGLRTMGEAFADRVYESDGRLRSRNKPDALITDPERASAQALGIVLRNEVIAHDGTSLIVQADSICVHSDTPAAIEILFAVRRALGDAGFEVRHW